MNTYRLNKIYFLLLASMVLLAPLKVASAASFIDSEVKNLEYPNRFKTTPFFEIEIILEDPEIASMVRKNFRLAIKYPVHTGIRLKHNRSLVMTRNLLPTSKPQLLIFEKTGCSKCDDFRNNVLRLKRVKNMLKQFELVSLNAMDDKTIIITPDGSLTTSSSLFRKYAFSRMPAIAFFNVRGNAVLKTDAVVLPQRMINSLNFVLEKVYKKGATYQKYAKQRQ